MSADDWSDCEEGCGTRVPMGPGDDWAICAACHARLSALLAAEINAEMRGKTQ